MGIPAIQMAHLDLPGQKETQIMASVEKGHGTP
jgi:hypothetical protein